MRRYASASRARSTKTRIETFRPYATPRLDLLLRELDPRKQGLKHQYTRPFSDLSDLRELDPRKQGLKPIPLRSANGRSQTSRARSTKTRIETHPTMVRFQARQTSRARSTKTRIETSNKDVLSLVGVAFES